MAEFLIHLVIRVIEAQRSGRLGLCPTTVSPGHYPELAELEKVTRRVRSYFDAIELLGNPTQRRDNTVLKSAADASASGISPTTEELTRLVELWKQGGCPPPKVSFWKRLSYGFLDPEPRMGYWGGISQNSFRMVYKEFSSNFDVVVAVEHATGKAAGRMFLKGEIDLPPHPCAPIAPLTEIQTRRIEKQPTVLTDAQDWVRK